MGSNADIDPTQAVDGLVRAMRDLTADTNYKLVADVFSQFLMLKERNDRLSISQREILDEYHRYRGELDEWKKKLEQEKENLEDVIQGKVQEIIQLSAIRSRLEHDLEDTTTTLETTRKDAAEAAERAANEFSELKSTKEQEYDELKTTKEQEFAEMKATKDQEFDEMKTAKEQEFADMKTLKEQEFADMKALKEQEFDEMKTTKEQEFADMKALKEQEYADLQALKEQELADLQAAKEAVEQAKKEADEAAAAAAEKAANEIAELTGTKTELEAWKAQAELDAEQAAKDIAELQEAKAGLEEVKANNEEEIATLKQNVATLEEQKKAVEDALEAANKEIEELKATLAEKNSEIENLQETLRAAEEQIASLQQTVEEKNAEIEDLHTKLTAEGERADKAIAHGQDLQARLDATDNELQVTSGKLMDLEQYRLVLHGDNEDVYVTVLDKIWTTIVNLVEGTFRADVDDSILSDPSCWINLRNSPYLKHATQLQIPLPQSNSAAAKGMRISAVLAVLSRALHRHLFRPVYLLDDEDENLVKFLRALEDEDPTREAHMRATLLSTMPERQMEQGARRVKTVVREVSWVVQHLLSALQFEAFCSGLEAACKLACEQWMRIQLASIKIEPYFGPPYDDFDWQVLELPEFTEAARSRRDFGMAIDDVDDAVTDGPLETVEASASMDGTSHDAFQDGASHAMTEDDGDIEPEEILLVVWPSMCSVENGDFMSITQGLVISKEQARPALEEVRSRSRLIPRPGSRRARTLSMPGQSRGSSPRGRPSHFLAQAQVVAAESNTDGGQDDG